MTIRAGVAALRAQIDREGKEPTDLILQFGKLEGQQEGAHITVIIGVELAEQLAHSMIANVAAARVAELVLRDGIESIVAPVIMRQGQEVANAAADNKAKSASPKPNRQERRAARRRGLGNGSSPN